MANRRILSKLNKRFEEKEKALDEKEKEIEEKVQLAQQADALLDRYDAILDRAMVALQEPPEPDPEPDGGALPDTESLEAVPPLRKEIVGEVKQVGAPADRTLEFIGSTEAKDREGDIIRSDGWILDQYMQNPIFLWAHNYREPPVGKATRVWIEENKLKFWIKFADASTYEFADTIYKLYQGGYLRASSVGFVPIEWNWIDEKQDDGPPKTTGREFTKQGLLELSGCPVPANPEALVQAQDEGIITAKQLEVLTRPAPDVTENYIRIRVKDPGLFQDDSFKTITISSSEGIKAVIGKLKGKTSTTVQSYLFDKNKWTVAQAQAWVNSHKDEVESWLVMFKETSPDSFVTHPIAQNLMSPQTITAGSGSSSTGDYQWQDSTTWKGNDWDTWSGDPPQGDFLESPTQKEIGDELDYLKELVQQDNFNEDNREALWELVRTILRIAGGDIPEDILVRVGAVLSAKNKADLKEALFRIQSVLDSAEKPLLEPEPEEQIVEPTPKVTPVNLEDLKTIVLEVKQEQRDYALGIVKR